VRSTSFTVAEKLMVTSACQNLIDDFLKPRFLPTIRSTQFNYPIDYPGKVARHQVSLELPSPEPARRRAPTPGRRSAACASLSAAALPHNLSVT
jgi:hypothetical protein